LTLLAVSSVVKAFPVGWLGRSQRLVLRGADLKVASGEICVLMGDNGSGKTTLLRMIAGLLIPDSGEVQVMGHSVQADASIRRLIGFASGDERSFQLRLSGLDNLRFFAALYGLTHPTALHRIRELAKALDLESFLRTPVGQCSAGMRARLGLARASLHQPKLLLLDEPTKSIDESHVSSVHSLARDCASAGGAVLVVTHSVAEARALSNRIERMDGGRIERWAAEASS
jgi:ABC-2 type transport system ATP-binding protein